MMKPVNHCVYVKPDAPIERKGNIILPQTNAMQSRGIVRASDSLLCKEGDHVVYARFFPIEVAGEELIVVNEKDLIGVDYEPDTKEIEAAAMIVEAGQAMAEALNNGISITPEG